MNSFLESTVGEVIVWCVGLSLLLFTLLGGIALIFNSAGDSWAEICVEQGGEFSHEQVPFENNTDEWADNERCELP